MRVGPAINASLKGGRRRRAEDAGKEVKQLLVLDPTLHQESWHRMKRWYQAAVNHVPLLTWVTLNRITADIVDLYQYVPPRGENIPVSVEPSPVKELVPM